MHTTNDDHMMYGSWDMECSRQFFLMLDHFLKILSKWKKTPEDIIILDKCTINDNHMMCDSWDMKHKRHVLWFWAIFSPFTPTNNQKFQNFEKVKKKYMEISSFYTSVRYAVPEIWHMRGVFIFNFGLIFALLFF